MFVDASFWRCEEESSGAFIGSQSRGACWRRRSIRGRGRRRLGERSTSCGSSVTAPSSAPGGRCPDCSHPKGASAVVRHRTSRLLDRQKLLLVVTDVITVFHRFADFIEGSPHLMSNEVSVHTQEYGLGGSYFEGELFDTDDEDEDVKITEFSEWGGSDVTHVSGGFCLS